MRRNNGREGNREYKEFGKEENLRKEDEEIKRTGEGKGEDTRGGRREGEERRIRRTEQERDEVKGEVMGRKKRSVWRIEEGVK